MSGFFMSDLFLLQLRNSESCSKLPLTNDWVGFNVSYIFYSLPSNKSLL